jgi:hypothetical protein
MIQERGIAVKTAVVKDDGGGPARMMVPAAIAAATSVGSVSLALVAETTDVSVSFALLIVAVLEVALVPVVQAVVPLFPLRLVDEFLDGVVGSMVGIPAVVVVAVVSQDAAQVGYATVVAGLMKAPSFRG